MLLRSPFIQGSVLPGNPQGIPSGENRSGPLPGAAYPLLQTRRFRIHHVRIRRFKIGAWWTGMVHRGWRFPPVHCIPGLNPASPAS